MSDDLDVRRRRAAYRAAHRGTKEMDALIGRYAAVRLPTFSVEALDRFEHLLATPDPTLQAWIFAHEDASAADFVSLVADIRAFHGLDVLAKAGPR